MLSESMSVQGWSRPASRLLVSFLAVTILPAAALFWLSWRSLEQDRLLEAERVRKRCEQAADLVVTALEQKLAALELRLGDSVPTAGDAFRVVFAGDRVEMRPPHRLIYYPVAPVGREAPEHIFSGGEALEFRQTDYVRATAAFGDLTKSSDLAVRAGAYLRMARNLRKGGKPEEALAAYEAMTGCGPVLLGGVPADLVARRARFALLEELHQTAHARREADALARDLDAGRWVLDRETYRHFAQEIGHESPAEAAALAAAVDWLWKRRQEAPAGREAVTAGGRQWVMLWRGESGLVAGPRYVEQAWFAPLAPLLKSQGVRLARDSASSAGDAQRTAAATGLPWSLQVESADPGADTRQFATRRRFLLAAAGLFSALVCAGSYLIARAVNRELAAARLQSDFVAAVSHEFRTPLTLLRQTTEAFVEGRAGDEAEREGFYQAQARATERLHRLVESLLDFGRMEAGAKPYRLQPTNAAQLVRGVVEEFQSEMASSGCRVELTVEAPAPVVEADPDALAHALWNLLDNAVKYSPACRTVWVHVGGRDGEVAIGVRDRGLGIPANEQREVFRKFVRGEAARLYGIKGAGIGLAMVAHIVEAHRGRVVLESTPGEGSTFTILLPARS